jgi:diaminohydroxyphosphoribosylaminopyrimidine deaminase/5-amino-6-(5-phosphoribosylamino)uracil reductase
VTQRADDERFMARALALAMLGEGRVEPNPMVGCVIVQGRQIVGEGFHAEFGGPHAEVAALEQAGEAARGGTLYVTLEPCCHHGKTPPCTEAMIRAGVVRVVAAVEDPYPEVGGRGITALRAAGVKCDVGTLASEARQALAPYRKLIMTGQPWIIAKWAMTLDGKIATKSGDSRWISSEASRQVVHQLRGRVDAILVGSGTAYRDDPLLTARPANLADVKRTAARVVVDSAATISTSSRLVQTARDLPLLLAVGEEAPPPACEQLASVGVEVVRCGGGSHAQRIASLLDELGRRRMTNVLVEGGGGLFGSLFDSRLVDEVHVFLSPKMIGGEAAFSPIGGIGIERISDAIKLNTLSMEELDGDVYIHGRVQGSGVRGSAIQGRNPTY